MLRPDALPLGRTMLTIPIRWLRCDRIRVSDVVSARKLLDTDLVIERGAFWLERLGNVFCFLFFFSNIHYHNS